MYQVIYNMYSLCHAIKSTWTQDQNIRIKKHSQFMCKCSL